MTLKDRTHDPDAETWVNSARAHREFPIQNLPLGVFSIAGGEPRIGCAIGDEIVDLRGLAVDGRLPPDVASLLAARALGMDVGPMSGFDAAGVTRTFFAGTSIEANFLCNLGYGTDDLLFPRQPRLEFGCG